MKGWKEREQAGEGLKEREQRVKGWKEREQRVKDREEGEQRVKGLRKAVRSADQSLKGQPSPLGDPFPGKEEKQEPSKQTGKGSWEGMQERAYVSICLSCRD